MARLQTNDPVIWNGVYESGISPWDAGEADEHLVHLVTSGSLQVGHTLDIGCGTGNEAVFLAKQGFDVIGIDLASDAISKAQNKARLNGVSTEFHILDILGKLPFEDFEFDIVHDRACFHFIPPQSVHLYLANLSRVLRAGGRYVLFAASEFDAHIRGPILYTRESLTEVFGGIFQIDAIQLVRLKQHALQPQPYFCCMTKR